VPCKGKPPQTDATHFLARRPVGELGVAPQLNDFAGASPGTFSVRHRPTTTMEIFQLFSTPDMSNHIIECTNYSVQRMLDGRIPRLNHLRLVDKWPLQWARSWTPLNYRSLCLWIDCCVTHSIVGVKETFNWSPVPFVAIPGITTISLWSVVGSFPQCVRDCVEPLPGDIRGRNDGVVHWVLQVEI
jgi:hypothetical protein